MDILKNQNCCGFYFLDNNFCYTLSHKMKGKLAGFRLYDLELMIDKGTDKSYWLSYAQVGLQGHMDYSRANQRLIFMESFDGLSVVPILHRNTIAFIGMGNRSNYLATRVLKDRFVCLDKKNVMTTWGILTGKKISQWNIKKKCEQDYSNYEIFAWDVK